MLFVTVIADSTPGSLFTPGGLTWQFSLTHQLTYKFFYDSFPCLFIPQGGQCSDILQRHSYTLKVKGNCLLTRITGFPEYILYICIFSVLVGILLLSVLVLSTNV